MTPEIHSAAWFDYTFDALGSEFIPTPLRMFSERLCREMNIRGSADPMYIANFVAFELKIGDGCSHFDEPGEPWILPNIDGQRIMDRLAFSYSTCIAGRKDLLKTIWDSEIVNGSWATSSVEESSEKPVG